ncbi:MAG TPA: imidazolonepropionase [Xanthomonadales bacterium]|nr:imidazolonepropionase [Xanthomonadales bacterium]
MPILKNISELATCPAGSSQQDAGLLHNAALVWQGQEIAWVGPADKIPNLYAAENVIDCHGGLVVPGLIDCHTHLCFGGWREQEFELRNEGASYQQIAEAGGGIRSTVKSTRAASLGSLLRSTLQHLDGMLQLGITTVECKSGYGLDLATELKQLEVYRQAAVRHQLDLVPTFLGAHSIPPEFINRRGGYIQLLCEEIIPMVAAEKLAVFCDIFVEQGAFTCDEAREVLSVAREFGMKLKIHADQLSDQGAAGLAAEMGAVSAEHLEYASEQGIRAMASAGVVAVSLPLASLYLREKQTPSRLFLDAGAQVAIATDFNPGSAPSYHLPLAMTLACINQALTPQEALMGATQVAAKALQLHHRIGSLQAGYQADIAVIDAPSLSQWLYHFRDNACQAVIKKGEWLKPVLTRLH